MASVLKARRVVNPTKRKRKLSAKQIKFFGTKRQRAALKRKRKNPLALKKRIRAFKTSRSVPGSSFRKSLKRALGSTKQMNPKRRKRVKNVGSIFTVTIPGNPGKKEKGSMAKRRRRNTSHRRRVTARRRRNPRYVGRIKRGVYKYANPRRHRHARRNGIASRRRRLVSRRRNPGLGSAGHLAKQSLYLIGGAVAVRSLTQMILKDKNVGAMGYVANAVGSLVLGMAASRFINKEAGTMVTLGGFTGVVLRMLQDLTPIGQYVNLQLSGMGMLGDVGMGAIVPTTFFVPLAQQSAGGGAINQMAMPAAVQALAAPPAKAGMRGVGAVVASGKGRYTSVGRYA